jgi:hypothetical protein
MTTAPGHPAAAGPSEQAAIVISPRFCGPPDTANGGYVCGLIAAHLGGSAEITLHRPPPVGIPLTLDRDAAHSVTLRAAEAVIATAVALPDGPALDLPGPVPLAAAQAAGEACRLRARPQEHPYPGCFVCGPDRADGLRILVGPLQDQGQCQTQTHAHAHPQDLAADVWHPDESLAAPDGTLPPEFLWAALDCPGGMGAIGNEFQNGPPWVLGRYAARQATPVQAGKPHVAVGWRLARTGRKMLAGSAVFTAAGDVAGYALATWIQLR